MALLLKNTIIEVKLKWIAEFDIFKPKSIASYHLKLASHEILQHKSADISNGLVYSRSFTS